MARTVFVALAVALCCATMASAVCNSEWCSRDKPSPDTMVPVLLAIKHKNLDELDRIFHAVSDPKSPSRGKYLSLFELNQLISNPEGTAAVRSYLVASGIPESALEVSAGGEFIKFRAPVSTVEAIFKADYAYFYHREKEGRRIPRSLVDVSIPVELEAHLDFVGYVRELPHEVAAIGMKVQNSTVESSLEDVHVDPQVLFTTYGINDHTATSGQMSMAVYESLGQAYSPDDLATFEQQFNVPAMKVAKVIGPNKPSECVANPNSCGEANLDVQYIMGVAQNIPLTFWSIAQSDQTPYLDWITAVANDANPPLVHSVSYGSIEAEMDDSVMSRTNTEFQKLGARGVTVFIASGDDGVANFPARTNAVDCGFNPSWPASSPYVTAVGATQFINGQPSDGQQGCSTKNSPPSLITTGGGFSAYNSRPSYQDNAVNNFLSNGYVPPVPHTASQFPSPGFNSGGRAYPDLSAMGHNYEVVINGNTYSVDGTSAASPLTAAMFALINDARLGNGQSALGFLNPTLYNLQGTSAITDLTQGDNKCTGYPGANAQQVCCQYGFEAGQGWDPVTGLGIVNFQQMKSALMN